MRVVIDTNLWVSYLIHPNSPLNPVLDHVAAKHTLLYSSSTLAELAEVLTRPKFARYIEAETVRAFIAEFIATGEEVVIDQEITACRDPRDNKFLELAVCGDADRILSGDKDLLMQHPFRGIAILTVAAFLKQPEGPKPRMG